MRNFFLFLYFMMLSTNIMALPSLKSFFHIQKPYEHYLGNIDNGMPKAINTLLDLKKIEKYIDINSDCKTIKFDNFIKNKFFYARILILEIQKELVRTKSQEVITVSDISKSCKYLTKRYKTFDNFVSLYSFYHLADEIIQIDRKLKNSL